LITAHGHSIRALVKTLENFSNDEIMEVNISTGVPFVYEFDEQWKVVKKYYLGDT
jgi:2,3-bisphosphoglycerate-dependent phosphoglycerate mutase